MLDACGIELFGADVTRSERSKKKRERLARLNRKRLKYPLSDDERCERDRLGRALPEAQCREVFTTTSLGPP